MPRTAVALNSATEGCGMVTVHVRLGCVFVKIYIGHSCTRNCSNCKVGYGVRPHIGNVTAVKDTTNDVADGFA